MLNGTKVPLWTQILFKTEITKILQCKTILFFTWLVTVAYKMYSNVIRSDNLDKVVK
jgi:hypothetical protein